MVVGRNFGSYVTHEVCLIEERPRSSSTRLSILSHPFPFFSLSPLRPQTKHFIYFYLGQVAVLLFKSG